MYVQGGVGRDKGDPEGWGTRGRRKCHNKTIVCYIETTSIKKKNETGRTSWRLKSSGCFPRGLRFDSQNSHGG